MKRRLIYLFLILAFFVPIAANVYRPKSAAAADSAPPSASSIKNGTYTWYDRNTIHAKIAGEEYYFRGNFRDGQLYYGVQDSSCYGHISFDSDNPSWPLSPDQKAPKSINVDMDFIDPTSTSSNCQNTDSNGTYPNEFKHLPIGDPQNFNIFFQVSSDGRHLIPVSGDDDNNYTQSGKYANLFTKDSENGDSCQDVIQVYKGTGTYKLYEIDKDGDGGPPPASIHAPANCKLTGHPGYVKMAVMQKLGNAGALKNDANPNPPGGGDEKDAEAPCESGGDPLNWILCPIYNAVSGVTDWLLSSVIMPMLHVNPICTNASGCGQSHNTTYEVWSNFRVYADVFLVIALLVVVFGESIGGGTIDAYTAKKVLPRLLIAAILINLSIYIVAALVDIFNVVGGSIGSLMTAPLKDAAAYSITPSGVQAGTIITGGIVGATLGGGTIIAAALTGGAGLSMLFFTLVIPAVLAMLAVFITLVIRQAIIMALVLISPIAFALWCLPNTESWFKRWWDLLFQMLLVYPVIVVIFAVADILSAITGGVHSDNPVNAIVSFLLLIIPLFMIPFALRQSGGILGQIHGAASAGGKKVNDLLEGKRAEVKNRFDKERVSKKAELYDQGARSKVGRGLSRVPGVGGSIRMRTRRAENKGNILTGEAMKDPRLAPVANDEMALRAGMAESKGAAMRDLMENHGLSRDEARQAVARWQATDLGFNKAANAAAFQTAVADGTVFKDQKDQARYIASIGGQNAPMRDRLWGSAYAGNKAASRFDLSPSFGRGQANVEALANGQAVSDEEWDSATVEALRNTSNTDLSRMKGAGFTNGADSAARNIQQLRTTVSDPTRSDAERQQAREQLAEAEVKLQNMKASSMYMPEASTKTLHERGINPTSGNARIVQQEASPTIRRVRVDNTGAVVHRRDAAGNVLLDEHNDPIPVIDEVPNPHYKPEVRRVSDEQRSRGGYDPNGPGGPLAP